jgi:hypothetical protein
LCVIDVGDLAVARPHCHGKLITLNPAGRQARRRFSRWLLLSAAGALLFAWVIWRTVTRA